MALALRNYDIAGSALTAYKTLDDSFRAEKKLELEQQAQERADKESAENSQIRQMTIRKMAKQETDEEESAEIAAVLTSGDFTKLRPEIALKVNKQLEEAGVTPDTVLPRLKAATTLKPIIEGLAEKSATWQQQAASQPGLQQADTVSLKMDPSYETLIKPNIKDLFFDKNRFNDKDGSPKLHEYDLNGQKVFGVVDQADPVADVVYHTPSGKVMVGLNVKAIKTDAAGKPLKDEAGQYVIDETVQLPNGVATKGRTSGQDDTISTLTLPELQLKTNELIKSGETVMQIRRRALEAEYVRRSPVAREGVSKAIAGRVENEQAWKAAASDETMQALVNDPALGGAYKNLILVTKAFGGTPKEALTKANGILDKAVEVAKDKADGEAFITTFSGLMEAAAKKPDNPYAGMVDFFKANPAMVGKKGAVEAIKIAQTAIASDLKNKTDIRKDELGWARVEAIANKSTAAAANTGARTINQEKRDVAVRLRDAQRNYATAIKSGDPAVINEAIDLLEYINDQAKDVGVPLVKVPARRETEEQAEALRQQATENLKKQRGAVGRFFNSSPSPKAVEAEMQRLRKSGATPASPAAQAAAAQQAPPKPAQPQQQTGKAFLSSNTVTIDGQSYPLNPDGTVSINGRKYRVQ